MSNVGVLTLWERMDNRRKALLVGGLTFLAIVFQAGLLRISLQFQPTEIPVQEKLQVRKDPLLFKWMTFGHFPAAIDWVFIESFFDQEIFKVKKGEHPPLYFSSELVTDIDPHFLSAYYDTSLLLVVVRDDIEGTLKLLLKGENHRTNVLPFLKNEDERKLLVEKHWKNGWVIPLLLAYTYLFEENNLPEASRYFIAASKVPGAPPYLARLQQRLLAVGGQYEVGLRLLNFMISISRDLKQRAELERKRKALFLSQFFYDLNSQFESYLNLKPEFRSKYTGALKDLEKHFERFRRETRTPKTDPFGAPLFLNQEGRITSNTPREIVFGLE